MPAASKQQQKFMGIVRAIQKGEAPAGKFSKAAQKAAKSMKKSSVRKYAKTKHDDLPKKVKEERDYKDEYKKFQSSKKAKKYRAELNKYNRQKGTYGNGDGKDASHKGGKIVGFEAQSKNRGRAEKSRLKKESSGENMANLQQRNLANSYIAKFDKDIKGIIKYLGRAGDRKKAMDLMKVYKKHWVEFVINWQKVQKLNESLEMNKLKDAIKMFQKKIEKQGRVTNARDEEHLSNLIKLYKQMGGKGVKEGLDNLKDTIKNLRKNVDKKEEGFASAAQRRAAFASGYKAKGKKKKKESVDEARGTCWVGYQQLGMKRKGGKMVPNCVKEITELYYEIDGKGYGYTFEYINDGKLNEAEYQGRKVKLGKPTAGDVKKFKVYVKNPQGNVVKVNFGHKGKGGEKTMRIKKSNPERRKSFRARHNCDNPGPRHKARYWSCRKW